MDRLLAGATMVTTMMPCAMCAGAMIRFGFREVVVAEMKTYADAGTGTLMRKQGIAVRVLDHPDAIALGEEMNRLRRTRWGDPSWDVAPLKF